VIHHIGIFASNVSASRAFFQHALEPLAIGVVYENHEVCEFWRDDADTPSL